MRTSFSLINLAYAILLFTASCASPSNNIKLTLTPTLLVSTQALTPKPPPSATQKVVSAIKSIEGSFRNQISNLEESMPRAHSERYVVPSGNEQKEFEKLVVMLNTADVATASQLAEQSHYELIYYTDRGDDNATSYLLREQKPIQKGWGLYAFRKGSTSNIIVEAPHPLYDRRSPSVALDIYRVLDARALLIAGAHRNANADSSADVAHAAESIFHSVHDSLMKQLSSVSRDFIVLQIHGFHTTKHTGYPQAVFGFGERMDASEFSIAQELEDALVAQGITVGLCTGDVWQELCGTTNMQASVTHGGIFIHMELDEKLRKNDKPLITALIKVFGK